MAKKEELSESMEDYLETILDLQKANKVARSKDIAEKMEIKRGSVTGMLKNLAQRELINYEPYGFITLTGKGELVAKEIKRRHIVIKDFLFRVLQVENDKAESTACRMEHAMDRSIVNRLVNFIEFIDNCPRAGENWMDHFNNYCSGRKPEKDKCSACLDECMESFK